MPWRPLTQIDVTYTFTPNTQSTGTVVSVSSNNVIDVQHSTDLKLPAARKFGDLTPPSLTSASQLLKHHLPVNKPIADGDSLTTGSPAIIKGGDISTKSNVEIEPIDEGRARRTSDSESAVVILD